MLNIEINEKDIPNINIGDILFLKIRENVFKYELEDYAKYKDLIDRYYSLSLSDRDFEMFFDSLISLHRYCYYDNDKKNVMNEFIDIKKICYILGRNCNLIENQQYGCIKDKQLIKKTITIDELHEDMKLLFKSPKLYMYDYDYYSTRELDNLIVNQVEDIFSIFLLGFRRCLAKNEYLKISTNTFMFVFNSLFALKIECYQQKYEHEELCIAFGNGMSSKTEALYLKHSGNYMRVGQYQYVPESIADMHFRTQSKYYKLSLKSSSMLDGEIINPLFSIRDFLEED